MAVVVVLVIKKKKNVLLILSTIILESGHHHQLCGEWKRGVAPFTSNLVHISMRVLWTFCPSRLGWWRNNRRKGSAGWATPIFREKVMVIGIQESEILTIGGGDWGQMGVTCRKRNGEKGGRIDLRWRGNSAIWEMVPGPSQLKFIKRKTEHSPGKNEIHPSIPREEKVLCKAFQKGEASMRVWAQARSLLQQSSLSLLPLM